MFERKIEVHQEEAFEGLEAAKKYAENAQKSTMKYGTFLERLQSLKIQGKKYLDVGAGPGTVAGLIVKQNPDVEITALELSADMVTVGQDYVQSLGLENRIKFIVGDAADEEIIEGLGQFDLIYSTYSLHHWENPKQVINNLVKCLTDNGVLFIHDLRRVWWLYWVPSQSGFFRSIRGAFIKQEIEEMLNDFSPESYEIKNEFPPFQLSVTIKKPTT